MKLSCLQENLARGLSTVSRAVAARSTLPITGNVLLATDDGRLRLTATNLEIAITCWVGAKIEEEGTTTVPARLLSEFITSLTPDRVDLTVPEGKHTLKIECGRNNADIGGMDPEDFPPIPEITDDSQVVKVEPTELRNAINRVVFAAATDESRPVLTGIYTTFEGDQMTLAAADGFRLAVNVSTLMNPVTQTSEAIIPARCFSEVNRLLADQEDPISLTINASGNQVLFQLSNVRVVSQLIQGNFPNYRQLIPENHTTRTIVNANDFLRATRTAAIFARDGNGIIRLMVQPATEGMAPGKMILSARSEEVGEGLGEIDALVEGEEAKIAFNARYLADVLGIMGRGNVILETTGPSSPGVLRPGDETKYTHVVMPMFVQWE